jgi:hypothetical protein
MGFGQDATRATGKTIDTSIVEGIDISRQPSFVLRDGSADRYTFDQIYGAKWYRFPRSAVRLPRRLASKAIRSVSTLISK